MSDSLRVAIDTSKRSLTTMVARGLPKDLIRSVPYDLNHHATTVRSEVEGMERKKVSKKRQMDDYRNLCADPFHGPYIAVFGSSPNDTRAKMAAAHLMQKAVGIQLRNADAKARSRQLPLWHTINGAFADRLRDGADDRPSMLVLSTITKESSNVKLEKMRDLLEQFPSIPRVVVLTGFDPLTFANSRLYMQVNHCLYIAAGRKIEL